MLSVIRRNTMLEPSSSSLIAAELIAERQRQVTHDFRRANPPRSRRFHLLPMRHSDRIS
jgi:hypothetical protein